MANQVGHVLLRLGLVGLLRGSRVGQWADAVTRSEKPSASESSWRLAAGAFVPGPRLCGREGEGHCDLVELLHCGDAEEDRGATRGEREPCGRHVGEEERRGGEGRGEEREGEERGT